MNASDDVPSPIDFQDPAQARAWEIETIRKRPDRPRFIAAMAAALSARCAPGCAVLELGSGPGHLAEQIVATCAVGRYVALDFSAAMYDLVRTRLPAAADKAEFVTRDFRLPGWGEGLGTFDAIGTMQAAHEVRHVRRIGDLLARGRALLRTGGLFLYCDHYAEAGDGKNPALHLARAEQPGVLLAAGFSDVQPLLDAGGMALYAAVSPA